MNKFNKYLEAAGIPKIVIIPKERWPRGKKDPTQWSQKEKEIQVRSDYDIDNDPAGWIEHEKVHARMPNQDTSNYPDNEVEKQAYSAQFKYLRSHGYSFDKIFSIKTMEHKKEYKDKLKKWWPE